MGKARLGNWSHCTVIGEGSEVVQCWFDVSSDGDIESLRVFGDVGEVTNYLHLTQIEELEYECSDAYLRDAKERNDDAMVDRYLSAQDSDSVGARA